MSHDNNNLPPPRTRATGLEEETNRDLNPGAPSGRANTESGIQNRLPEVEEPRPIGNPQYLGPQHGMGISDTIGSNIENDIESNRFISAHHKLQNLIRPSVDFKDPSTFACYGSAEQYYRDAFYRITETYPYDGSRAERLEWLLSASALDVSVLRHVYPKATGYVNFSLSDTGSISSNSTYYNLTDKLEYIAFDGGVNPNTRYLPSLRMTNNIEIDGEHGNTVEFWLKKSKFEDASKREVVFDSYTVNSPLPANTGHGRFLVELTGSSSNPFLVTYLSGNVGFSSRQITTNLTSGQVADGKWHHYAVSVANTGSALKARLYVDGVLEKDTAGHPQETIKNSTNVGRVLLTMSGTIGAAAAPVSTVTTTTQAGLGWGKLSGSVDDFRFWKTERNAREIGVYYDKPVYGATVDDITHAPGLGLYYKFNEGILGQDSTDNIILDYSGRIANGLFVGYNSTSRVAGSAITDSAAVNNESADPVMYEALTRGTLQEYIKIGKGYDSQNHTALAKSVPQWAYDSDGEGSSNIKSQMGILLQAMASEFDSIKSYIDNLTRIKSSELTEFTNVTGSNYVFSDDQYLFGCANEFSVNSAGFEDNSKLARLQLMGRGFNVDPPKGSNYTESALSRYETIEEMFYGQGDPQSPSILFEQNTYDIKNKILKNIYRNLNHIFKSKGTEASYRNLIRCFGIDENLIRLNVYANNEEREILNEPVYTAVKKKTISFEGVNKDANIIQTSSASNEEETRKFMSGSTYLMTPWTAEGSFIFPKLNVPAAITNSSLYGCGPTYDSAPVVTTPAVAATSSSGYISIASSPPTGSTITIIDGASDDDDLNTIVLEARHDDSKTNYLRGDNISWNNIPVYARVQKGNNFGGDGSDHEFPGGYAQFYLYPLQIGTDSGTYNGMWRTHWSSGKSEPIQIQILDANTKILKINFVDTGSFSTNIVSITASGGGTKTAYQNRVRRNSDNDYSVASQFSLVAAAGGHITEWFYNVGMAITDAAQRGHIKLQNTELMDAAGDQRANNITEAASISYYSPMNAGIVQGTMQVKADDNTLGAGTGQPLGVRIAQYAGEDTWTQLASGSLRLNGGEDGDSSPEHYWNGNGPQIATAATQRVLTASFDSQDWIFAPGGVPQSSSLAGPSNTGYLTNTEIASQIQRIINNLPANFDATLDNTVVNIQNQNNGAAGNQAIVVNNVGGGASQVGVGMHSGSDGTPSTHTGGDLSNQLSFNVSAIKHPNKDDTAYFKLTSSLGQFHEITSSYYQQVYNNSRWNFAVIASKDSSVPFGEIDDYGYKVEFIGKQYDVDVLRNSFHLTSAINQTEYEYWSKFNKSFYMGAERTHLTGAIVNSADTRGIFLNVWTDKLNHNEIKEHALNVNNYGRENPQLVNAHNTGSNRLNLNTLALSWQFDNNPAFSSSVLSIVDFASGSLGDVEKYGEVVGYKYPGISENFTNQNTAIVQDYLQSVEYVELDNAYTSDRVKIKDQEIDKFTTDSRPITYDFAFEKSMYQIISKEMLNFVAGLVSFNNMLGEPVNKYRPNYKMLEKVKEKFFSRVQNDVDLDQFVNYYKWIDASLGRMLYELQPASSNLRADLKNVVESHALERNKYQHKAPTLEFKEPSLPETPFLGINELLYDWEHGHSADNEANNCLWQKERKERENTAGRQTLNNIITKDVEGSTYVLRSLTKPYKFSVDRQDFLIPGSNRKANKIDGLYKVINSGKEISISANDIYDFKKCDDILDPNKKKIYTAKTDTSDTDGYLDADADLILPFTLHSSSVGNDFSDFKEKLAITNNHDDEDSITALQGPFTRAHVGGMPHRRVPFGTPEQNRPEGYDIVEAAGSITVKSPGMNSTPKSMFHRDLGSMRFMNIANIKHTTSSLLLGNYNKDYEVVITNARASNNNYFIDNEGSFIGTEPYGTSRNLREPREQPQPNAQPLAAVGTIVYDANPASGNQVNIISATGVDKTYEFRDEGVSASAPKITVTRGANARASIDNLKTAIDANHGSTVTVVHTNGGNVNTGTLTITQASAGPDGNTVLSRTGAWTDSITGFSGGKFFAGSSVRTQFINHPERDYALPDRGRTEHVIVNRFSAHEASFDPSGSAIGADSYKYDKASGELSVYSTMNYRNLRVRTDLNYDSAQPFAQTYTLLPTGGYARSRGNAVIDHRPRHANGEVIPKPSTFGDTFGVHSAYKSIAGNPFLDRYSKYNGFVQGEIPSYDLGYSWIRTSQVIYPDTSYLNPGSYFLLRNGGFRHQFIGGDVTTYGPHHAENRKLNTDTTRSNKTISSAESIQFLSQSEFGVVEYPGQLGLVYGLNAPSVFSPTSWRSHLFVDFAGLNTIVREPLSSSANSLGHESFTITQGSSPHIGWINYINDEIVAGPFLGGSGHAQAGKDLAGLSGDGAGLVLNSIILNRQGPYGWPSWKQTRGGSHPVMRHHRKNNTFSIVRRGTSFNVSSLMDYHFSFHPAEQINVPNANKDGTGSETGAVPVTTKTSARTVENYKDIFATNRFNPLTLTKHRMKRPTDSAFAELGTLMIRGNATSQLVEHQMWNADEYYYNVATDPSQELGLLQERFSEEGDATENFIFDVDSIQSIREVMHGSVSLRVSFQNELTTYANPEIIKDLNVDEIKPHRFDAIYETWFPESTAQNKDRELRELNYIETIYPREENTFTKNARTREGFVFHGYPTAVRADRTYTRAPEHKTPTNDNVIGGWSDNTSYRHTTIQRPDYWQYRYTVSGTFADMSPMVLPIIKTYKKSISVPGRHQIWPERMLNTEINEKNHFQHTFFGSYQYINARQIHDDSISLGDLDYTALSLTAMTMSSWPLDGPLMDPVEIQNTWGGNYTGIAQIHSWGLRGPSSGYTLKTWMRNRMDQRSDSAGSLNKGGGQGGRGQGMFQNDFGNWPCGLNLIYGTPPPSIVYNRKIPQTAYIRAADAGTAGEEYLAGEAIWSAADNKPKPFFNSYEEYRDEMRRVGQDHSIVPEFRISEYVEKFFDLDSFSDISCIKDDFLSLTGAIHQHSSGDIQVGSQFFKTYGTSDFMKYFGVVTERLDVQEKFDKPYAGGMVPTKLTLRCQAVKRFLPYRGFYPAERIMQLGEIFHDNYLKSGSYSAAPNSYITGGLPNHARYNLLDHRIRASKQQAMKLIFGPGILMNSIKAGLAVDYPMLPIRDVGPGQGKSQFVPEGGNPFPGATGDYCLTNILATEWILTESCQMACFADVAHTHICSGSATEKIADLTGTDYLYQFKGVMGDPVVSLTTSGSSDSSTWHFMSSLGTIYTAGFTGSLLNRTTDEGIPRLHGGVYSYDVDNPYYIRDEKKGILSRVPNNFIVEDFPADSNLQEPIKPETYTLYYGPQVCNAFWYLGLPEGSG